MEREITCLSFGLLGLCASAAHAQDAMYQCDPLRPRLRIDLLIDKTQPLPVLRDSRPQVALQFPDFEPVDSEEREKEGLSPLRGPSGIVKMNCGPLQIHLRSEALNSNPSGELGSITFGSVEVLVAGQVLLESTHLAVCDTLPRWGPCDSLYATSVLLDFNARTASARATIVRRFTDASGKETSRTDKLKNLRPKPANR